MPVDRLVVLQRFLSEFNLQGLRGVEIGPYDRPVLRRSEFPKVEYADVFTTEELRKHASLNPKRDPGAVVPVDHVLRDKRLSDIVEHNSLDFVFCSHVLEHVPDLIGELKGIEAILKPGGLLLCAYPDRRFTFDIDRKATPYEDFRKRHATGARKPDPETVYDYFANYRQVFVGRIWQGLPGAKGPKTYTEDYARDMKAKAEDDYVDVHCNVLTDAEFLSFVENLKREGLLGMEVSVFRKSAAPLNEFFFALRKVSNASV